MQNLLNSTYIWEKTGKLHSLILSIMTIRFRIFVSASGWTWGGGEIRAAAPAVGRDRCFSSKTDQRPAGRWIKAFKDFHLVTLPVALRPWARCYY